MGTVVVSDGSYSSPFLNTKYGDPSSWVEVPSGHGVGYSRSLMVMPDQSELLVFNGGMYGGGNTTVSAGIYTVPGPKSNWPPSASCQKSGPGGGQWGKGGWGLRGPPAWGGKGWFGGWGW